MDFAKIAGESTLFLPDRVKPWPVESLPMVRALSGEIVDGIEMFVRTPSASDGIWIVVNARPLKNSHGDLMGGILAIRDITAARSAEEAALEGEEAERKRLARELHDSVSQNLCALILELESILGDLPDSAVQLRERLNVHKGELLELSDEVTAVALRLHPAVLDQLGLTRATEQLCKESADRKGLVVEFSHRDLPPYVPMRVALCLYRVAQEGLRNVLRHAQTKHAAVSLSGCGTELRLSIEDEGVGFNPESVSARTSLGLVSIRERVRLAGGTLSIESQPGAGTRIMLRVPMGDEDD